MKFLRSLFVLLPILALCLATSAFGDVVFSGAPVADVVNPSPAGSTGLGPLGAVGGIGGAVPFIAPFSGTLTMTVTDCCLVGDVYQVFVDGVSLGFTAAVPLGGPTLSTGVFTDYLTAGAHTYDINDQILSYIGFADPYGGGVVPAIYAPAGLTVQGTMVPEPASIFLLGAELIGLGALARKLRKTRG